MKERTFTKGSSRIAIIGLLFIMLAAFAMLMPLKAHASTLSGICKGVSWEIDSNGVLTLGQKGETQVLDNTATEVIVKDYVKFGHHDTDQIADAEKMLAQRAEWDWLSNGRDERITKIVIAGNIQAKGSLSFIFSGLRNLESLSGMDKIDTKEATSVAYMFLKRSWDSQKEEWVDVGAPNLKSIEGIKSWDMSNIISASLAFAYIGAEEIDLSGWTTSSKLEMFPAVFESCRDLKTIKFGEGLDTSNVRHMGYLFKNCSSITTIEGLKYLDTDRTTTTVQMFYGCGALENLDLSNFNTANCTDMASMFSGCTSLKEVDVSSFNTSNVTDMNDMFHACRALQKIDVSGFDTSKVTGMKQMFRFCTSLKQIDGLGDFDMSKVKDASYMFIQCLGMDLINGLEKLDIDNIKNVSNMFAADTVLKNPFQAILADTTASDEAKASAQAAIDALDILCNRASTDSAIKEAFAILKANYPVIYGTESYKGEVSELIDTAKAASAKAAALESEANNAKVVAELAKQKAAASMKEAEAALKNNPGSQEAIKAAEKALEDAKAAEKASADAARAAEIAAAVANYAAAVAQNAKEAAQANGDPALVAEAEALPDGIAAKERTANAAAEAGANLEGAREHRKNAEELYWKAFYADADKALTDAKDALQKAKDSKTAADG
ncbi:MAG: BspA family leucine-rich repeat surface protein, partial [Mogibacterium sp.]|nr:BspA family leucine-rich repeat surface protein [Mogibacterium sp.]